MLADIELSLGVMAVTLAALGKNSALLVSVALRSAEEPLEAIRMVHQLISRQLWQFCGSSKSISGEFDSSGLRKLLKV